MSTSPGLENTRCVLGGAQCGAMDHQREVHRHPIRNRVQRQRFPAVMRVRPQSAHGRLRHTAHASAARDSFSIHARTASRSSAAGRAARSCQLGSSRGSGIARGDGLGVEHDAFGVGQFRSSSRRRAAPARPAAHRRRSPFPPRARRRTTRSRAARAASRRLSMPVRGLKPIMPGEGHRLQAGQTHHAVRGEEGLAKPQAGQTHHAVRGEEGHKPQAGQTHHAVRGEEGLQRSHRLSKPVSNHAQPPSRRRARPAASTRLPQGERNRSRTVTRSPGNFGWRHCPAFQWKAAAYHPRSAIRESACASPWFRCSRSPPPPARRRRRTPRPPRRRSRPCRSRRRPRRRPAWIDVGMSRRISAWKCATPAATIHRRDRARLRSEEVPAAGTGGEGAGAGAGRPAFAGPVADIFDCYRPVRGCMPSSPGRTTCPTSAPKPSTIPTSTSPLCSGLHRPKPRATHAAARPSTSACCVCDAGACAPLDMGADFDLFDPRANTDRPRSPRRSARIASCCSTR